MTVHYKKFYSAFGQISHWKTLGFSILEIMIALAIIGIIAAVGFPSYIDYKNRVDISDAIADIATIEHAIARYEIGHDIQPATLAAIGMDNLEDPWGNPYRYLSFDANPPKGFMRKDHSLVPVNSDYDLYSMGKDGVTASPFTSHLSQDDIVRANNGAYKGIVEDY